MRNLARYVSVISLAVPLAVTAQAYQIENLVTRVGDLVRGLIGVLAGVALLVFFWGLVKFIYAASEEGKSEGKNFMIWGVIALFVMVSVWGLVYFIQGELGLPGFADPRIPNVPGFNR